MTLHAVFTKDGIPSWIGTEPREGSEPVDGLSVEFLSAHRRTEKGEWVPRDPPPPPTAEEIAAREAVATQAKADQEARDAEEREERLMRRMLRIMDLRLRGEITQTQYITRTDAVRAKFEA